MNISLENVHKSTPKVAKFGAVFFILFTTGLAMWLKETTLVSTLVKNEGALVLKVMDSIVVVLVQFLGHDKTD